MLIILSVVWERKGMKYVQVYFPMKERGLTDKILFTNFIQLKDELYYLIVSTP